MSLSAAIPPHTHPNPPPQAGEGKSVVWRKQLYPLNLAQPYKLNADIEDYLQRYQLDFFKNLPQVSYHLGSFISGKYQLAAQLFQHQQAKGTIFVMHGYYDHVGLMRHLIKYLVDNQYSVVAYDLPGHGLSSGNSAYINSFDDYVTTLKDCLAVVENHMPKPWHIIGQSTGAAVIMDYLLSHSWTSAQPCPFTKIVLLAPLVRPVKWFKARLNYYLARPFIKKVKRIFLENSSDVTFLQFVQQEDVLQCHDLPVQWVGALACWIPKMEAFLPSKLSPLVIQGNKDTTVEWRHNVAVVQKKFTQPKIICHPEARHHLVNEAKPIRDEVFNAIGQYLSC